MFEALFMATAIRCGIVSPIDPVDGIRSAVSAAGDVDKDGFRDFLVRHKGVHLISGKDGNAIFYIPVAAVGFGNSLDTIGDADGDAVPDFIVGTRERTALVYSGGSGSVLHRVNEPRSASGLRGFGQVVGGGGDLDADGHGDFLVGAPGRASVGRAYLYSGRTGELLRIFEGSRDGIQSWGTNELRPTNPSYPKYGAGTSAVILPDLTGDGIAELSIGCPVRVARSTTNARGYLEILSGEDWSSIYRFVSPTAEESYSFAWQGDSVGDVNGDGVVDIGCTAPSWSASIFSGATGEQLWHLSFRGADMNGEGTTLVSAGDLDGDGSSEWLLGANESGMFQDRGFVELWSDDGQRRQWTPHPANEGMDACGLNGDANGDDTPDFVIYRRVAQTVSLISGKDMSLQYEIDLDALVVSTQAVEQR